MEDRLANYGIRLNPNWLVLQDEDEFTVSVFIRLSTTEAIGVLTSLLVRVTEPVAIVVTQIEGMCNLHVSFNKALA